MRLQTAYAHNRDARYELRYPRLRNNEDNIQETTDVVKIATSQVKEFEYNHQVITSGKVTSSEESKLSFKTGGVINAILVKEGDMVKKDQVLATLDMAEINANVKQARLGYEKAKRDYERVKNLYQDSVATLEQFQDVTTGLEFAKSNMEIAEFNLKYSSVRREEVVGIISLRNRADGVQKIDNGRACKLSFITEHA